MKRYRRRIYSIVFWGKFIAVSVLLGILGAVSCELGAKNLGYSFYMFATAVIFALLFIISLQAHEDKIISEEKKYETAINKKSFLLYYEDGNIWNECLESMYDNYEGVRAKVDEDFKELDGSETPDYMIVNLDDTMIDEELLKHIFKKIKDMNTVKKLAFVGLSGSGKRTLKKVIKNATINNVFIKAVDDYEVAKEWIMSAD